jgi:hypothetical protein
LFVLNLSNDAYHYMLFTRVQYIRDGEDVCS